MKKELVDKCAEIFMIPSELILGRKHRKYISPARFALYKALRMRGWTYPQIGEFLGRDHATVIYGVRRAEYMMGRDPRYAEKVEAIAAWRPKPLTMPLVWR
jgi:chromosomal replication initiation ATPase DnaA